MDYKPFGDEWKEHVFMLQKRALVEMLADAHIERIKATSALHDLFQACSRLPIEQMDMLEKEINAAAEALK